MLIGLDYFSDLSLCLSQLLQLKYNERIEIIKPFLLSEFTRPLLRSCASLSETKSNHSAGLLLISDIPDNLYILIAPYTCSHFYILRSASLKRRTNKSEVARKYAGEVSHEKHAPSKP